MAFSFSFLSRYRSAILAITAIAAGCTIFYVQTTASSPSSSSASVTSTSQHAGLHRSNAQRGRRRRRDQLSSETERQSREIGETDGQSGEAGDPEVQNHSVMSAGNPPSIAFVANSTQPTALMNSFTPEPQAEEDLITELEVMSDDSWDAESPTEQKNRLHLLYRIAEEQSIREGYIHRGINCNSCNQLPIRGIRFRCANCSDYDLCEQCEANEPHIKTHVFFKIKVPIPFLGSPRQRPLPVFYPGKPTQPRESQRLPFITVTQYAKENDFTHSEVEALWDQFLCLASPPLLKTSSDDDLAISRQTFQKWFVPPSAIRSAATNLIYDRMFNFYDIDRDGIISFSEFLSGLSCLTKLGKASEKLRRIFDGYDIDQNGWVDRNDFIRMFRAYYALNKELTKEMVMAWGNELSDEEVLMGSQPISSAFSGDVATDQHSRAGEGKTQDENGDYVIQDGGGILSEPPNDIGDHSEVSASLFESNSNRNPGDAEYRDLEDSILAEEIPEAERDVGREIIYQVTQEALHDLLDPLFREREADSLSALHTRRERQQLRELLEQTCIESDAESVSYTTDYYQKNIQTQGSDNIVEPMQSAIPRAQNTELSEQTLDAVHSEEASRPRPDPTLPQHRPNSESLEPEQRAAPSSTNSATSKNISASLGNRDRDRDDLDFLHSMDVIEAEDNKRGGPGRISCDEFIEVLTGPAGARMGFLGAWVDLAVF